MDMEEKKVREVEMEGKETWEGEKEKERKGTKWNDGQVSAPVMLRFAKYWKRRWIVPNR